MLLNINLFLIVVIFAGMLIDWASHYHGVHNNDVCLFTDKLPTYSHCTYEDGLCGWHEKEMTWMRQNGSHANGPSEDHTYKNASG